MLWSYCEWGQCKVRHEMQHPTLWVESVPLSLQPTDNKTWHVARPTSFHYQKQASSDVKNGYAFRKSSNTAYLLSEHGNFPLQTVTLSKVYSKPRLSSLRRQGLRKRELSHPTYPWAAAVISASPVSKPQCSIPPSLPACAGSAAEAADTSLLLGWALPWSCEGSGRELRHRSLAGPQPPRAQHQQNNTWLGFSSEKGHTMSKLNN